MRAVLTRVKSASVTIDGQCVGKIGQGFLILLGVGPKDTEKECRYLAEKALGLRIFEDENEKMNLGLEAVHGQVLVVNDMLGMFDRVPKFVKRYQDMAGVIDGAVRDYAGEVRSRSFPTGDQIYEG